MKWQTATQQGDCRAFKEKLGWFCLLATLLSLTALPAGASSFQVQCPSTTTTHPTGDGIKCQQISGGDGFATMGDGTQTYLFAFGPLSGLADIYQGKAGTQPASIFNQQSPTGTGTPSSLVGMPDDTFTFNGAIGLVPDPEVSTDPRCDGTPAQPSYCTTGLDGYVDPRLIMDVGVMNGSAPGPLMAIDEDDEFFLTLTNVGQIMRPDLFEQHTVHFHGYPNASAYFDGVPDASAAINIGGSFTYYYMAPDAGTYFWHCHITPPEHLQMGMEGQIYVRPRQNKLTSSTTLYAGLQAQQLDKRKKCDVNDILCSNPLPAVNTGAMGGGKYAYNDGDGSTAYDVEYPLQMMGFDPNFHFVGMTFNPETFTDLKDKYFLLNGRSYPDTIGGKPDGTLGPMSTQSTDGTLHASQPMPALITILAGQKALLRISDLNITEFHTLASLGMPMHVIAQNARLLRDQAGNNMAYDTNSITLGGGESLDVILDATDTTKYPAGSVFYLYTPNLDHLSNDAENFGGMMTEIHIVASI